MNYIMAGFCLGLGLTIYAIVFLVFMLAFNNLVRIVKNKKYNNRSMQI